MILVYSADIFLTRKLYSEADDKQMLTMGVKEVLNLIQEWQCVPNFGGDRLGGDPWDNCWKDFQLGSVSIVLGTRDETSEKRKKFKGRKLGELKLELINLLSGEDFCSSKSRILEIMEEIESYCSSVDRYAFYMPKECKDAPINDLLHVVHVVKSPNENNLRENSNFVFDFSYSDFPNFDGKVVSGYIMMPYDIKGEDKVPIFNTKFYQALYHELFHYLVVDRFSGILKVDEGLAEVYSELCFHQFLKRKLKGSKRNHIHKEYIDLIKHGAYSRYYEYVKEEMCLKELCEDDYSWFCHFYEGLLFQTAENYCENREHNRRISHADYFLECGMRSQEWKKIFENECKNHKSLWKCNSLSEAI